MGLQKVIIGSYKLLCLALIYLTAINIIFGFSTEEVNFVISHQYYNIGDSLVRNA